MQRSLSGQGLLVDVSGLQSTTLVDIGVTVQHYMQSLLRLAVLSGVFCQSRCISVPTDQHPLVLIFAILPICFCLMYQGRWKQFESGSAKAGN